MAYFDPFCPIFTGLLFLNWILWWEITVIWKKLSIVLVGKFHEFSFGKTRFLIGFHLLNPWAFAVSFPNGGSTKQLTRTNIRKSHPKNKVTAQLTEDV